MGMDVGNSHPAGGAHGASGGGHMRDRAAGRSDAADRPGATGRARAAEGGMGAGHGAGGAGHQKARKSLDASAGAVGGAAGGAVKGVAELGAKPGAAGATVGGGDTAPGSDIAASISGLQAILDELKAAIAQLSPSASVAGASGGGATGGGTAGAASGGCGMTAVKGRSGEAATAQQFVAPISTVATQQITAEKEDSAFEQQVLELVNRERAAAGLQPVTYNGVLDTAAEQHATHMSGVGRMAHEGIGDADPGTRIRAAGFRDSWGENVATGQTSPEQVVREWMASPEHRRNIMNPDYRQLGVSQVTSQGGRSYWAQEFGA